MDVIKDIGSDLAFFETALSQYQRSMKVYCVGFDIRYLWEIMPVQGEEWRYLSYRKRAVSKMESGRFYCGYLNDGYLYTNHMHRLALAVIYAWYGFLKGSKWMKLS